MIKEFTIKLESNIFIPKCILCENSENRMIKVERVTAEDGIETSHVPIYICMTCIDKIQGCISH